MEWTSEKLAVLNDLRDDVYTNAKDKGFKKPPPNTGITQEQWDSPAFDIIRAAIYTANQHGEASEFWEAGRKGKLAETCDKAIGMVSLGLPALTCAEEEIADEIIRALDKAKQFNVDVAKAIHAKMVYNSQRAYQHGGKLA